MAEFVCLECLRGGRPCPAHESPNRGNATAAAAGGRARAKRGRDRHPRQENDGAQQNARAQPQTPNRQTNRGADRAAGRQQPPRQPRQQEPRQQRGGEEGRAQDDLQHILNQLQFGLQGRGRVAYARGGRPGEQGGAPLNVRVVDEGMPMGRWVVNAVHNLLDALEAYEDFMGVFEQIFPPRAAEQGLHPDEIARLPVVAMDEERLQASPHCTICLVDFIANQDAIELGCRHSFHRDCIARWLRQHKTCPVCRRQVEPNNEPANEDYPIDTDALD